MLTVLLLAGLVAVLHQPLGRLAIGVAVRLLARSVDARVHYQRIEGDLFRNPVVVGLEVHSNGDSLRVERVALRYSPFGFLGGRIPISRLELDRPELFLTGQPGPDTDTEFRMPEFPELNLELLTVRNARVYLRDTLRADSLDIVASGRSERMSVQFELHQLQGLAVQERIALRTGTARARLFEVEADRPGQYTLLLEQVDLRTDRSRLSGSMRLALDEAVATLELSNLIVDLAELARPLDMDPEVLAGVFRARGNVEIGESHQKAAVSYVFERPGFGAIRLPDLAGTLRLDQALLHLVVSGRDNTLGEFSVNGTFDYEQLSYQFQAGLRGTRTAGFDPTLPDMELDVDLVVAGVALDPVQVNAGGRVPGLGIDTFRLTGRRVGRHYELSRFVASGGSGRIQASGSWWSGGRIQGECLFEDFEIGPFAGLAGVEASGRLKGLVRGEGSLDSITASGGVRLEDFRSGELSLDAGVVEFDATLGRELHGRLVAGAEQVRWGEQHLDEISISLLDPDFDLRAERYGDRLTARGGFRLGRDRVRLDVNWFEFAASAETLRLVEPFLVDWSADSLAVRGVRYELADGTLEFDVAQIGRATPELTLRARGLDLKRLRELTGLDTEIGGTLEFTIAGADTLRGHLTVTDLDAPAQGIRAKHGSLEMRYVHQPVHRLILDDLSLVHREDTSRVFGWIQLDPDGGFEVKEVDIEALLADPGVWPFRFLEEVVEVRAGQIHGSLAFRGDPAVPDMSGRLRISRAQLWLPSVNLLVERVSSEVTVDDGRVEIRKISGAAGTGIVTAEGFVQLGTDWNVDTLALEISFDDAVARPLPEVHLVASGRALLSLAADRPLSIEGYLDVREALLAFGFGRESPPPAPVEDETPVVYDIRIRGDRGIWLRNRVADIELSLDLSLRKTLHDETWTGQLSTRQGNIYYLDRTLRVTRGEIRFESISTLDPELDIVAELPVRIRNGEPDQLPERIILTLTGTLSKPEFRFSSEPVAWDESEILTYLSLSVTPAEFDAFHDREAVARYLSGRLLGLAQTRFTKRVREWLAVDALRFESELTGGEGQRVTVGKYVGRDLYITYTQNFTGEMLPEFRVEYYLDRRNELVGERNEHGRFLVRYRHRFRY